MELHLIQRRILQRLIKGSRRFSELQPDGIENNLFQYHLNRLVGAKIVQKEDKEYLLTPMGTQIAAQWSTDLQKVRIQPVVVVMSLVFNDEGELLVLERHKQPFLGALSPPFGKVHYSETLARAVARDLSEKTGIEGIDLHVHQVVEMLTDNMHTIAHVFVGHIEGAQKGKFMKISMLLKSPKVMPGLTFLSEN